MWYFKGKERNEMVLTQIDAVRARLEQWRDYHEQRSVSTPGKAYSAADIVAEAIYHARIPLQSINTPDTELDLNVPTSTIKLLLEKARVNKKLPYLELYL